MAAVRRRATKLAEGEQHLSIRGHGHWLGWWPALVCLGDWLSWCTYLELGADGSGALRRYRAGGEDPVMAEGVVGDLGVVDSPPAEHGA